MAYFNNLISTISLFYPGLCWKIPNKEKIIYLTFDDGPIPGVTDFVLEQLEAWKAQATFFCVGENIRKNPDYLNKFTTAGHAFGNHTYNHLNGWNTENPRYIENVHLCQQAVTDAVGTPSDISGNGKLPLFRPPYGKIKKSQIQLLDKHYDIIMWNVLTGDFDQQQKPERCLKEAIRHTRAGSIVIFHDSIKAEKNLTYALPRYLEHFISRGYQFLPL